MKTGTTVALILATVVLIATTFAYASYAQMQTYPYPSTTTPSQGRYNGRCSGYLGYYGGMMGYMMGGHEGGGYRGDMMSGYFGAPMMGECGAYGGWYP